MIHACFFFCSSKPQILQEHVQKCSGKKTAWGEKGFKVYVWKWLLKKMRSQWRHTGSCLGYCLRKDTDECLWRGHIWKLKRCALFRTRTLDYFNVFPFLVMVHGKHYLWICLLTEFDPSLALIFASELHYTFCYLRMYCGKHPRPLVWFVMLTVNTGFHSLVQSN